MVSKILVGLMAVASVELILLTVFVPASLGWGWIFLLSLVVLCVIIAVIVVAVTVLLQVRHRARQQQLQQTQEQALERPARQKVHEVVPGRRRGDKVIRIKPYRDRSGFVRLPPNVTFHRRDNLREGRDG